MGGASGVQVYFVYGTTTAYGSSSATQNVTNTCYFSIHIQGLTPSTAYHYQVLAINTTGEGQGSDVTFTTPPVTSSTTTTTNIITTSAVTSVTTTGTAAVATPYVKTVTPTTNVTANSADLRGDLINMGSSTKVQVYFVYGPTTAYGSTSATQDMTSIGFFSINIQGLAPSTTYHFQAIAVEDSGNYQGADVTFTTLSGQTVVPTTTTTTIPAPTTTTPPIVTITTAIVVTPPAPIAQQPVKTTAEVSPNQNSSIQSSDGMIKLSIPKSAVSTTSEIEFDEYSPEPSTGSIVVNRFDLTAKDETTGVSFSKFNQNLQITIQNNPSEVAGIDPNSIKLYYLDTTTKQWVPVASSKFDPATNILTATTNHFTNYSEIGNPLSVGPGRILAAQVGLQSGASMFSYPLTLPPGPGGFQPQLNLTYNSTSVDEMKDKQDVGSWVGIGWTCDLGNISYDGSRNTYYLELNGVSYQLVTSDGTNFYTMPDEHFKITRSVNTWSVYDTSGNFYQFGGTTDSEQYIGGTSGTYYKWNISLTHDTNSNQATVTYHQDVMGTGANSWVRSAYPLTMTYGSIQVSFTTAYDVNDPTDGYLRNDDPKTTNQNPPPLVFDNRKLTNITITASNNVVREYNFSYDTTNATLSTDYGGIYYAGTLELKSITQVGSDGTSTLPAMTFSYENDQTYLQDSVGFAYVGNPGNPASFTWPHLDLINSGYGGSTSFAYTQVPAAGTQDVWTREVVTTETINPGIGPSQTSTYSYTGNPQYLVNNSNDWPAVFEGFSQVRETDANGNYVLHYFNTTDPNDGTPQILTGLETETQWYSSNGTLLKTVQNQYGYTNTAQVYNYLRQCGDWEPDGMFNSPHAVAVSSSNNVYIADTQNNRIQEFSNTGNFITQWGTFGSGNGQFLSPEGIAVDSSGNVYVADAGNNRIQKFTSTGTFITSWSGSAAYGPAGITVGSDGYVYVVFPSSNCVQKFSNTGTYVTRWGTQGSGNGQFNAPWSIAFDSNGYVYVTDGNNNRVQKFTNVGIYVAQWGTQGNGNGQFNMPIGITADSNGYIYVTDGDNNRVQKFTNTGTYVMQWGSLGNGNGQFHLPYGIAIDSSSNIYVTDYYNNRIEKFGNTGNFVAVWGVSLSLTSDGEFDWPFGIAVGSSGYVYVADSNNSRIQEFSSAGTFVTTWGSAGSGNGQFEDPEGIAVDSNGNVWVADTMNSRIQEFSSTGTFITSWGSFGTGIGQFEYPCGITIGSDGDVYVNDTDNCRVQKFTSSGTFITGWGSAGTGNGQFEDPTGITMGSDGYIYVTDGSCRVQKFTTTGTFVTSFGSIGSGNGQFLTPLGITADNNGYLYVADEENDRVEKFSNAGTFISAWGSNGNGEGQFEAPDGIAIDSYGYIYVIDTLNSRIEKFQQDYSIQLNQVDTTVGNKTSQTRYSYDSYGNITTEYDDGDTSTTLDDSTIWRVYDPNTTLNILNKPARIRTYATAMSTDNGGGNLKQETDYDYDLQSYGTPPAKGNLTSAVQSIDVSHSITTSYTYDSYGNKLTETDGNGNHTTWTYDTTYHTYPATMTDPITSLTQSYAFDPGTNNILSTIGVNGQTTYDYYDPLKRLSSVVKPGDNQSSPSITYTYGNWGTLYSQCVTTTTKIDSGAGDTTWSTDYFDGLGRVIQTQTQGQTISHTTISCTAVYNNCGEVAQQYVSQDIGSKLTAYYTTGINGWKYTAYTYDGMGRVLTQTNPDGTVTTNNYSTPWKTTTTDANGVSTVDVYDGFSRLIQVQNLPGTTVVTNTSSSVGNTTATLNGNLTVLGNASGATVSFQYGTSTAYGSTIAGTPSTLSAAGTFTANLTGLTVGTTYHIRTEAVTATTTVYGADQSFVTTGGSTPPTVSSAAATNISSTWATLNGNVSNMGSAASVSVSFDYGPTTSYGSNITAVPSPMTATGSFTINLTGLTPGTVYHYRAKATGNGTTNGGDQQFTTSSGGTPVVITKSVVMGADDGFAGSGTFDNSDSWYEVGQPYNAWFRFTGITIPSGATIVAAHLILIEGQWDSGTSLKISADNSQSPTAPTSQSNLASKTRTSTNVSWTSGSFDYQWHNSPDFTTVIQQLVNSFTYSNGAIQLLVDNYNSSSGAEAVGGTFEDTGYAPQLYIQYQTSGGSSTTLPSVSTGTTSNVGASTVTLNGSLTNLGSASSAAVCFEYGTTTNYGNTATGSPSSLTSTGTFTANLTGLAPSTTYHYCTEAVGAATTLGNDQQFTTTSSGGGTVAFTQSVATAADDGFSGSGTFDNTDSWYEVGQPYNAWFRFTGITIPAGATIIAAHLVTIEGQWGSGTSLKISADNSQSPVAPTSQSDLAGKTRTSTNVSWTSGSSDYQWHNSPDFTSVIQQLVNSFAYSNGAIQILVDNNNSSSGAEAVGNTFEDTGYAPQLYIQYQTSGGAPSAIVTNYTYDVLGNLTTVTDNNSNSTSMTYDGLSRKTGMTDPDMGSWSYTYDADGNPLTQTDNKGQQITMVYDAMDRITNKNYPSGSGMTNIVYSYDSTANGNGNYGLGLQTGMTDASGTTSYTYDNRGRLTAETKTINSTSYTTDYTYDGLDRVATITYPNPNGTPETVTNTYNASGLPSTVTSSAEGNLVTGTTYNQLGDISEIDLNSGNNNNGVKTTYGYYGTGGTNDTTGGYYGQLWQIKSTNQSTTLQDIQYSWDANGNLTQQQNLVSGQTENFTYDYLDRLTTASGAYSQTYTYDDLGNITSMTNNGNTQFYSYGAKPDAVTQAGSASYAYDANGNMTTRGAQTIGWNVDNQPTTISGGTSFVYDGNGNRVEETTGGQTTVYINQYYQKNITTGVVTTYYYLGSQLVAQNTGSTLKFAIQDKLGSTSTMTTSAGTLDSSISYYPFGSVQSGSVNTVKQFTGQILDSTGLYYYNARYYDPTIGRFISADTAAPDMQNPQSLNKYSYCLNNPLNRTDPTGLFSWNTFWKAAAIVGAVAIVAGTVWIAICSGSPIAIGAAVGECVNTTAYIAKGLRNNDITCAGIFSAVVSGGIAGGIAASGWAGPGVGTLITGGIGNEFGKTAGDLTEKGASELTGESCNSDLNYDTSKNGVAANIDSGALFGIAGEALNAGINGLIATKDGIGAYIDRSTDFFNNGCNNNSGAMVVAASVTGLNGTIFDDMLKQELTYTSPDQYDR
jgi:RHS repeat-associated protein